MNNNNKKEEGGTNVRATFSHFANKDYTALVDPIEEFSTCQKACGDFIACLNELADSYLNDTMAMLRQEKFFRQKIKQDANSAQRALQTNISEATSRVKVQYKQWYYEYVDAYQKHMDKDVKMLYWTIHQVLTKAEYGKYAKMFAMLETTRLLIGMSVQAFEELFKDSYNRCRYDWSKWFGYCKPAGALMYWGRVEDTLIKQYGIGKDVYLPDEEPVVMAYNIILRRMVNGDYLDESASEAIEEMYDTMTDEQKAEYEQIKANAERNKKNGQQ